MADVPQPRRSEVRKTVPETRWELHKLDGDRVEIRQVTTVVIGPFETREQARQHMVKTTEERKAVLRRV